MLKKWIGFCVILITIGVGLYLYAAHETSQQVKTQLDQFVAEFSETGQGEISYQDVSVGLFGKHIKIHDVEFLPADNADPSLNIEQITVSNFNLTQEENRLPPQLHLALERATVTISNIDERLSDADQQAINILSEAFDVKNNTASFVYDAELGYKLNEKTGVLNIYTDYDVENMLSSGFVINLANMPKFSELDISDDAEMMNQLSNAAITQLSFTLSDKGLLDKLYQAAILDPQVIESMKEMNQEPTVNNFKQLLISQLEETNPSPGTATNPLAQQFTDYSRQFIEADKPQLDVTITAIKSEGLGFSDLMVLFISGGHPDLVKQLLDFQVKVK